jgi:hypothetical protein
VSNQNARRRAKPRNALSGSNAPNAMIAVAYALTNDRIQAVVEAKVANPLEAGAIAK